MDRHVVTAEQFATTVVELPSSMSPTPLPEFVHGIWQDLPSALIQHPHFSLSKDDSLLAMSEVIALPCQTGNLSRVFVFRMPSVGQIVSKLSHVHAVELNETTRESEALDKPQGDVYNVQRLPSSVGCVSGKILDFGFDQTAYSGALGQHQLVAITELGKKSFTLLDS